MEPLTGSYDTSMKDQVIHLFKLQSPETVAAAKSICLTFLEYCANCELLEACRGGRREIDENRISDRHLHTLYGAVIRDSPPPLESMIDAILPGTHFCDIILSHPAGETTFLSWKDNISHAMIKHFDDLVTPYFLRALSFLALRTFGILLSSSHGADLTTTHQTIHPIMTFLSEFHAHYGLPPSGGYRAKSVKTAVDIFTTTHRDPFHAKVMQLGQMPHFFDKKYM